MVDEIVVGFEDAVGEPIVAHELPDVLDRVELWALRRQQNDGDIGRHEEAGGQLLARFRMSRGYLNAKVRAYKLLVEAYVPMVQKAKKEVGDLSRKWSWFEEFYKKCKPSPAGKEDPDRVYDGPVLEQKFCQWMLNDQLPRAEDVRRLYDCLEDKKAIAVLDKGGTIDKAHVVAAATRPELVSKLWKSIEEVTDRLNNIPLSELDALRAGDASRAEKFNALLEALRRVRTETRAKH